MRFSSENYSQALRIYDLVKESATSISDGKLIYSHNRAEVGASYLGLGLAYLRRLDGVVYHSQDAALIYYYEKQDVSDIEQRNYTYELDVNALASEGITLSYQYAFDQGAWVKFSLDLAATDYLTDGLLDGDLNYGDEALSATAEVEYVYERDVLFDREVKAAEGRLAAFSLNMGFNTSSTRHELKIDDLYHKVRWEGAPYTRLTANSDRVGSISSTGKLEIRPLGAGVEGFRDVDQKLDARYYILNAWNLSSGALLFDINHIAEKWWPKLGYAFNLGDQVLSLKYSTTDEAVEVSYCWAQNVKLSFAIDDINYKEAHRFNLGFEFMAF